MVSAQGIYPETLLLAPILVGCLVESLLVQKAPENMTNPERPPIQGYELGSRFIAPHVGQSGRVSPLLTSP